MNVCRIIFENFCFSVPYTELIFEFNNNNTKLFDDLNIFKSVCKLEWSLRARYTNCSTNHSCCELIGPGNSNPPVTKN
jgi:hypothetical protein